MDAIDKNQEQIIIEKAKNDVRYFELIYRAYVRSVYAYVFFVLKDKDGAEDITAETFRIALDNLADFKWQGVSIKFWLFQIARNQLKKYWREKQKEVKWKPNMTVGEDEGEKILEWLIDEEAIEGVKKCLEELDPLEAEVIKLKIWEEFSFEEIAQITGYTVSKIKMRYYRGLKKLKEKLMAKDIEIGYNFPI